MPEKDGAVSDRKFGYNAGVDTIIEIRSEDANLTYQTSAQILEILSADAADDGQSSGTLTLVSAVAITAATGTATLLAVTVGDTVTINGNEYEAISGDKAGDFTKFDIDGDDTADAADLADSINNDTRTGTLNDVSATSSVGVVTVTQTVAGAGGNATTLAETGTTITISGATFTGGLDADTATVNGLVYIGIAGSKAGDNTKFSIDTSDTAAALDLAASIDQDTRVGTTVPGTDVSATSSSGVVTVEAEVIGSGGDLVDISGTSNITASGATLTDVGTGAHSVTVEGLDANYVEVSETISVNGTTAKDLTQTFLRVNRAFIKAVGSGGANVGLITVQVTGGGDVQITIPALQGESQATNFSVAFDKEVLLKSIDWSINQVAGEDVVALLGGQFRKVNEGWREFFSVVGTGSDTKRYDDSVIFPPKTDIKFLATKLNGTGDVSVHLGYQYKIQRG